MGVVSGVAVTLAAVPVAEWRLFVLLLFLMSLWWWWWWWWWFCCRGCAVQVEVSRLWVLSLHVVGCHCVSLQL